MRIENVGQLELRHDGIYRCEEEVRDGLHWVLVLPKNHLEAAIAKHSAPIAGEEELRAKMREILAERVAQAFSDGAAQHEKVWGAALMNEIANLKAQQAERVKEAELHGRQKCDPIFKWLLGAEGDFAPRPEGAGRYWWRTELAKRIAELEAKR